MCLSSNLREGQTDIVAYKGAIKRSSSRVHWILGRLHAKIQKIRNILFRNLFQTDQPTDGKPTDQSTGRWA